MHPDPHTYPTLISQNDDHIFPHNPHLVSCISESISVGISLTPLFATHSGKHGPCISQHLGQPTLHVQIIRVYLPSCLSFSPRLHIRWGICTPLRHLCTRKPTQYSTISVQNFLITRCKCKPIVYLVFVSHDHTRIECESPKRPITIKDVLSYTDERCSIVSSEIVPMTTNPDDWCLFSLRVESIQNPNNHPYSTCSNCKLCSDAKMSRDAR